MAYHRPSELSVALDLLARPGLRILAGGTDIFPGVAARRLSGDFIDITGIDGLAGISARDGVWRIGAATTWSAIGRAQLPPGFSALQQAARMVGSLQIQNSGTIGGNICNASPAADGMPPLLVLDARVEIARAAGVREVALADFVSGVRRIELDPGEMVTAILVPGGDGGAAFEKLGARKYLVISICMAAARIGMVDGKITRAAVAVGSCSPVARRLPGLEAALIGRDAGRSVIGDMDVGARIAGELAAIGDIRADAAYRDEAAAELVKRVVVRACGAKQ
jgi:CO/xanthine dehydrogenase FAD-binding subunit